MRKLPTSLETCPTVAAPDAAIPAAAMSSTMASAHAASMMFTSGRCDICGKLLKSSNPEAMAAHQRESQSCMPPPSKGNAPKAVKDAEEHLAAIIEEGQRLQMSGSYEEVERNTAKRKEAEQALKRARSECKAEKRQIKDLAAASMSAAAWTSTLSSALDGGGDGRFAKAEEHVEHALAARTVGLVSAEDFAKRREAVEAETAGKREREEQERLERKQAKKAKREQKERSRLSFEEDADPD